MYSIEPDSQLVRSRLEEMDENCAKSLGLMSQFLWGCRRSELCGKWAILNDDIFFDNFQGYDVTVFYLKTAKRGGKIRPIALPRNDPWLPHILDHFKDTEGKVFNYSPKTLYRTALEAYEGLEYKIDRYKDFEESEKLGEAIWIDTHNRRAGTHFARHIRAKELVMRYHFTPIQLAYFMGWSIGRSLGGSNMMDKYIDLQWHDYIPKLLQFSNTNTLA